MNFSQQKTCWSKFISNENNSLCPPEALDLISKMLIYDHDERITAKEAMEHNYFAPVKKYQEIIKFKK
jgi:casein kinase II subunit alpha